MAGAVLPVGRGAAIVAIVATLSILTDALNFRSPWNLAWMIGIPFAWALPLGTLSSSLLRLLALFGLSFLTMIVTAALFHLGP